jgi:hypothetical protein
LPLSIVAPQPFLAKFAASVRAVYGLNVAGHAVRRRLQRRPSALASGRISFSFLSAFCPRHTLALPRASAAHAA